MVLIFQTFFVLLEMVGGRGLLVFGLELTKDSRLKDSLVNELFASNEWTDGYKSAQARADWQLDGHTTWMAVFPLPNYLPSSRSMHTTEVIMALLKAETNTKQPPSLYTAIYFSVGYQWTCHSSNSLPSSSERQKRSQLLVGPFWALPDPATVAFTSNRLFCNTRALAVIAFALHW